MAWGSGTLKQGSRGEDVRRLQEFLKNRGFDPGPIDGIFGSRTAAAVRSYQSANNLSADGIVGPKTWGAITGGGPSAQATESGKSLIEQFKERFPGLGFFADVPELQTLLEQGMKERWTLEQFQGRIQSSEWRKNQTFTQQEWITLPEAEKKIRIDNAISRVIEHNIQVFGRGWLTQNSKHKLDAASAENRRLGEALASGTLTFEMFQLNNWLTAVSYGDTLEGVAELKRQEQLARDAKRPEEMGEELWKMAHGDYFTQVSKEAALAWARDIIAGRSSLAEYTQYLRQQAATLYPVYADSINNGVLPGDLFSPAFGIFERELGMSREQVLASDKLWGTIVGQATGRTDPFTAADWTRFVREQPEWDRSDTARELGANFGTRLRDLFQFGRQVA